MAAYDVPVPATTANIRVFLNQERERFERDYKTVFDLVIESISRIKVYKVYGRGDDQGRPSLKHPRKVRLKFNSYFEKIKKNKGSLWSVPDIIGFTIVVAYPSDINNICRVIDKLVEDRRLFNANAVLSPAEPSRMRDNNRGENLIETRYGREITSDGYFACHYNLRTRGAGAQRPICEIQIKTILHDAWGAKSHDLTYKPMSRTSTELIDNFNLLGDTLAKIDQQSDLVRRSIERTANVRERKKACVQLALIELVAQSFAQNTKEVAPLVNEICSLELDQITSELASSLSDRLLAQFEGHKQAVCVAFCLLSTRSRDARILQQAQETIETWYEEAETSIEKILSKSIAGLASYSGNEVADAIEMAEQAVDLIEQLDRKNLSATDATRLDRLANSTFTSLAYYHAERVGSHEGKLGQSEKFALEYLEKSKIFRERLGLLPQGIASSDDDLRRALNDPVLGWAAFSTLDNECFVRIQTAQTEHELRGVKKRLDFIHGERPSTYGAAASLLFDYHEFCARSMLAELEAG